MDLSNSFAFVRISTLHQHSLRLIKINAANGNSASLKLEINSIYDEIRRNCSYFRYICILRTMTNLRKKYYQEVLNVHNKKISRLLYKETDADEHILNISSYELFFFQKLVLCRGLKFAIPQRVSLVDVKASFEKAYWRLGPNLPDDLKELSAATLRFVALNNIHRKGPKPPQIAPTGHRSVKATRRY